MNEESRSCSSNSESNSNPCPICLGPFKQEAYLDRCFHKFCYSCIASWAKYVANQYSQPQSLLKCPFCKTDNFSIIYGYDGESFQQHHINQAPETSTFLSEAHKYRLQSYYSKPDSICDKFNVLQYWKSRKYLQPNKWLQSWLRREIQALTQEEDVDIIVHHILGVIESFVKLTIRDRTKGTPEHKREELKALISDAVKPFLFGRTDRFVNEVELFLASGLSIEAYDKVYFQSLGLSAPGETSEVVEECSREQTTKVPYLHFFDDGSDND